MIDISVNCMGLNLKSPFIAASSGLTTQPEKVAAFAKAGAGAIVVKSLFEEQIANEAEFLDSLSHDYTEAADYLHYYTRQNALDKYLQLIKELKKLVDIPVIASINCYNTGEWTAFSKEIEAAGADGIELNIYSLPLDTKKSSESIEKEYLVAVKAVCGSVKIPVAVKIGDSFTNIPGFVSSLKAYGAKAVTMFNRFYRPDIDIKTLKIIPADAFSQPEEHIQGLRWVAITTSLVKNIDIVSNTGIHNGSDAIKHLLAGASAVQMCSALYKKGPEAIAEAIGDLHLFMDKQGFKTIEDFKGRLNYESISNPGKFERVQFIKNYSSKK